MSEPPATALSGPGTASAPPAQLEPDAIVWGSEMRLGVSCGQLGSDVVLMGKSAEDLFPVDPVLGEVDRLGWASLCLIRRELAERAMRPGRLVVHQVLGQHPVQVLLIDDQQPVEEFPAQVPMTVRRSRSLGEPAAGWPGS